MEMMGQVYTSRLLNREIITCYRPFPQCNVKGIGAKPESCWLRELSGFVSTVNLQQSAMSCGYNLGLGSSKATVLNSGSLLESAAVHSEGCGATEGECVWVAHWRRILIINRQIKYPLSTALPLSFNVLVVKAIRCGINPDR